MWLVMERVLGLGMDVVCSFVVVDVFNFDIVDFVCMIVVSLVVWCGMFFILLCEAAFAL